MKPQRLHVGAVCVTFVGVYLLYPDLLASCSSALSVLLAIFLFQSRPVYENAGKRSITLEESSLSSVSLLASDRGVGVEFSSQTQRSDLSISREVTMSIVASRGLPHNIGVQAVPSTSSSESNTVASDSKDRDCQTWEVTEEQSVGTTQSLLQFVEDNKENQIHCYKKQEDEEAKSPPVENPVKVYRKEDYEEAKAPPIKRSNSEEFRTSEPDLEDDEEEAQMIHIEPMTLIENKLFSTLHTNTGQCVFDHKPLLGLFLSLEDIDFERLFGRRTFAPEFIDVYPANSPLESDLCNKEFDMLSTWFLGCHISDYIVLIIDYKKTPELHHSDFLFKFFCLLKEVEKPLYILHDSENYAYSFARTSELIEQAWSNDRVLLHEEVTLDASKNAQMLEGIREQMMDNLFTEGLALDLNERFLTAVEALVNSSLVVVNSRKREILVKCEQHLSESGVCVGVSLEPNWHCSIKEEFNVKLTKPRTYLSPIMYNIDQNLKCTLRASHLVRDDLVKVGVLSNVPPMALSYSVLQHVEKAFDQHADEVVLLLASSECVLPSSYNHVNSPEFNLCSQSLMIESASDCLVLVLEYERQIALDAPALGRMLSFHFRQEGVKKPIMVMHHFKGTTESSEIYRLFLQAVDVFSDFLGVWTGLSSRNISAHQNNSEGIYGFDKENQIIHRAMVLDGPIGWTWYNSILYKIMHDAALKFGVQKLNQAMTRGLSACLKDLVQISEDQEMVIPVVKTVKDNFRESSKFDVFRNSVLTELQPSWTINSLL